MNICWVCSPSLTWTSGLGSKKWQLLWTASVAKKRGRKLHCGLSNISMIALSVFISVWISLGVTAQNLCVAWGCEWFNGSAFTGSLCVPHLLLWASAISRVVLAVDRYYKRQTYQMPGHFFVDKSFYRGSFPWFLLISWMLSFFDKACGFLTRNTNDSTLYEGQPVLHSFGASCIKIYAYYWKYAPRWWDQNGAHVR